VVGRIVWLKWRLAAGAVARDWRRALALVLALAGLLPTALLLAAATLVAYRRLPADAAGELLSTVFFTVWVLWLLLPAMAVSLTEGLSPARLAVYPIAGWELLAGLLGASVAGLPTLLGGLFFLAALVGFGAGPLVWLGVLLGLAHVLVGNQALVTLASGFLRNRRTRDLVALLVPLVAVSLWLLVRFAEADPFGRAAGGPAAGAQGPGGPLVALGPSRFLQFTPPGTAARVVERAAAGDLPAALAWALGSAAYLGVAVALWRTALRRAMTGPPPGSDRPGPGSRSRRGLLGVGGSGGPVLALAAKDLRYAWRAPRLRAAWASAAVTSLVLVAAGLVRGRVGLGPRDLEPALLLPAVVLFGTLNVGFNAFGWEGHPLAVLLAVPVHARELLLGKHLALAAVLGAGVAGVGAILAAITGQVTETLVGLAAAPATLGIALAVGGLCSVLLPYPVPEDDANLLATSEQQGCTVALFQLAAFTVVSVLLVPVAAAVAWPLFAGRGWWALTLPLATGYGLVAYLVALTLAAGLFERRGPEILAATRG
jgi:ABC-2 type transport system permease protein